MAISAGFLAAHGAAQEAAPGPGRIELTGITGPFRTAVLASIHPARIERIVAVEGQSVRRGELVVQLEEGAQTARTEMARTAAESTLSVELAQTRWQQATRDLERLVRLHGDDQTSSKEMSDAFATAEIARLEYELARFNQAQAALAYERERKMLAEYRILAPFDGYVAEHLKHQGETVDQLEGVVRLAQVDPLLVTVDCPLSLASRIAQGDEARVRPVDEHSAPRVGQVVLANRVADGASQTFRVKLAVGNADRAWLAGLKVLVEFGSRSDGQPSGAAAAAGSSRPNGAAWGPREPSDRQ